MRLPRYPGSEHRWGPSLEMCSLSPFAEHIILTSMALHTHIRWGVY